MTLDICTYVYSYMCVFIYVGLSYLETLPGSQVFLHVHVCLSLCVCVRVPACMYSYLYLHLSTVRFMCVCLCSCLMMFIFVSISGYWYSMSPYISLFIIFSNANTGPNTNSK